MSNFNIGDIIYTTNMNDQIIMAEIKNFESDEVAIIHWISPFGGTSMQLLSECYKSKEECISAVDDRIKKETDEYCEQICNISDLVNFALNYNLFGADKNIAAYNAYTKRASELGIVIQ